MENFSHNSQLTSRELTLISKNLDGYLVKVTQIKNKEEGETLKTRTTGYDFKLTQSIQSCENLIQVEKLKAYCMIGGIAATHLFASRFIPLALSLLEPKDPFLFIDSKKSSLLHSLLLVYSGLFVFAGVLGVRLLYPQIQKISSEIIRLNELLEEHLLVWEKSQKLANQITILGLLQSEDSLNFPKEKFQEGTSTMMRTEP